MHSPYPSQVFAAAVYLLGNAPCPECGGTHGKTGWNVHCAWCAERAVALDLYRKWKARDAGVLGDALARRIA